nr:glutathione S-transferase theta-like 1 [Halisarca dujardinii]
MSLRFFADILGPPTRAVMVLMDKEAVPYDYVFINLAKAETKTNPELAAVNPCKKVPAIDDKGFGLWESAAILKYLVRAYNLPSHWYPEDVQKRARVDQYLAWHQGNIRNGLCFNMVIAPSRGIKVPEGKVKQLKTDMKKGLEVLENYFLSGEGPFMCGSEMTIADLQAVCELTQFWITHSPIEDSWPKIGKWVGACIDYLGEPFTKAHKTILDMKEEGKFKAEVKWDDV